MKTNRRNFFQTLGAGAAGLGLSSVPFISGAANASKTEADDQQLQVGDNIAIAQTKYGKVKGFILRGIYNYRGIPYGADTSGKKPVYASTASKTLGQHFTNRLVGKYRSPNHGQPIRQCVFVVCRSLEL